MDSSAYNDNDDPNEVTRRLREGPSAPEELREDYEALGEELRGDIDGVSQEVAELRKEIQELTREGTDALKEGAETRSNVWGAEKDIQKGKMDTLILTVVLMFFLYNTGHLWSGAFLNAWIFYRIYTDFRDSDWRKKIRSDKERA